MIVYSHFSPNFDSREGQKIDMLVLHYTGMKNAAAALARLSDSRTEKKVSCHYLVDEDGTVYQMIPEDQRAWHAGVASWRGHANVNQRSIGVEIVNPGHELGYRPFPKAQMDAVTMLSKSIVERHGIAGWNVVAHSDVAPGRKSDPGELFDWVMLARQGVGLMPPKGRRVSLLKAPFEWAKKLFSASEAPALRAGMTGAQVVRLQERLAALGYETGRHGVFDDALQKTVIAFQRHFMPDEVNGVWNAKCDAALGDLLKLAPSATMAAPDGRMAACAL